MWSVLDMVEKAVHDVPLTGEIRLDEPMGFRDILSVRVFGLGLTFSF